MKKTIVSILSLAMVLSMAPAGMVWATDDGSVVANEAEVSVNTEASAEAYSEQGITDDSDSIILDEVIGDENNDVVRLAAGSVVVDSAVKNGTVTLNGSSGTAKPADGYDLSAIKVGSGSNEQYVDYTGSASSGYNFTLPSGASGTLTAYFYNLKKWDGAVDVSWYDPDKTEFDISTPAQLAGLAAIVNGAVDTNVTKEIMIKDNGGRSGKGGKYTHKYISSVAEKANLLTPNSGKQVRDKVWRLPKVSHKKIASDDVHNDFLYRTVRLTADINMGDKNWTPIGGKYALNPKAKGDTDPHVVDTRFQGVFDGQGHTVTLKCDRIATKGFAYAMEIALIGYLGGGVDYKNGYPKDTCADYEKYWVPTARNVVVKGDVKGMRMVAGVVGRIGETNHGVIVENCANYASVYSTDMRGCAGIAGAAWGKSVIRNCYNAGTIHSTYWEFGGICGSNGYEGSEGREAGGADIYNCYNIGSVGIKDVGNGKYEYDGQEIGVDGQAFASYTVANCYYIAPSKTVAKKTGYSAGETSVNRRAKISEVSAINLKSDEALQKLNRNGKVFVKDTDNVNKGYPVLFFQTNEYKNNASKYGTGSVSLESAQNGKLTSKDELKNIKYGNGVGLIATPNKGYRFSHYEMDFGDGYKEVKTGDYVSVCGATVKVKAVFKENIGAPIAFPTKSDGEDYYVTVTKVHDSSTGSNTKKSLNNKDMVYAGDIIKIVPHMKSGKNRHPDIKSLEYTGEFDDPICTEDSLESKDRLDKTYTVTGNTNVVEISFKPGTQGKRWTSVANTSWYKKGKKTYTITTAKQLAGVAKLCQKGTTFKGVTIKLGKDISLKNSKGNSGDQFGSERNWTGIGTYRNPFEGTFDGQGHTVSNLHRNFAIGYCEGDCGGLFGVTDGAVIKNVNVTCGSYDNSDGQKMECALKNGANGGGIVGDALDTQINNCSSNVVMDEAYLAGGIVGTAEGRTTINDCQSEAKISGTNTSIGGIVGFIDGGNVVVNHCRFIGTIISDSYKVGGIVGDGSTANLNITSCQNLGALTVAMKGSTAKHAVGGILGTSDGNVKIEGCVNKGVVKGEAETYSIAGIAGNMNKGSIIDCYNAAVINLVSGASEAQISGIANLGGSNASQVKVSNCYNIGKISAASAAAKGGIVGVGNAESNKIENSYCSTSSVAAVGGSAGIAGEVVADDMLKTYAATLGSAYLDDTDNANQGFPVLAWESVAEITKLSVAKSGKTAAKLTWKVSGPAKGYEVYRSNSFNGKYSKVKALSKKTFTNKSLKKGKTYFYKVRAYKTINSKKAYGAYSVVKSVKIK